MATVVRNRKQKPCVLSLDAEARLILAQCAPSDKAHGSFVSMLLREYRARLEERAQADEDYKVLQRLYNLPVREERVATVEE